MDNEVSTIRSDIGYKGKSTKFWLQLPEEVLSLIATHYLYILAEQSYCPTTWDNRKLWYSRMAYTCIRDALDIERHISSICPEWRRGMEKHPFWSQVINVIDPNDLLVDKMIFYPKLPLNGSSNAKSSPIYLSPYRHLRNILTGACVICRINHPMLNTGLDAAKRVVYSPMLGYISVCTDHAKHKTDYCGLCLREAPPVHSQDATSRDYDMVQSVGIYENRDEETWPNTKHTCRRCRLEYLVRTANYNPRDREALGGPNLQCPDWEVRYKIERFVEYAEGKIGGVIVTAREKAWFRANTKYESLAQHAAAQRMLPRSDGRGAEGRERKESLLLKELIQVRSWALLDWARQRVLDGHWVIPADQWYESTVPGQPSVVGTVHPCPWARAADGVETYSDDDVHPSETIVNAEIPPTFALCKEASDTFVKQLNEVLEPAMKNIARKIVMECSVETDKGYEIPSEKARKMSLEDVLTLLREEEGVWYDGVDWVEKRKNEDDNKSNAQVAEAVSKVDEPDLQKEDDLDSTTSSSSSGNESGKLSARGSSNATSPVLSTSTLQTTPSPPPIIEDIQKKDHATSQQRTYSSYPRMIPVDPVKYPPRLLNKIPYIPVTLAHMPFDSLETFKNIWRDACAPVYKCNCTVCERAKAEELNARAALAAMNPQPTTGALQRGTVFPVTQYDGIEIELQEAIGDLDGEGEEEVEYEASDMDYDDDDDDDEYDEDDDGAYCYSPDIGVMELIQQVPPSRKRSSDELEDSHYSELIMVEDRTTSNDSLSSFQGSDLRDLEGTPPKRPRLDNDKDHHLTVVQNNAPLPHRKPQKKRSSEELEDDDGPADHHVTTNKRVRVGEDKPFLQDFNPETPSHLSLDDQASLPKPKVPLVTRDRTIRTEGMRTSDMKTLIALNDVRE